MSLELEERSCSSSNSECCERGDCHCCCNEADNDADVLHVIVPISNYICYKKRYELFEKFKKHIESLDNIKLYIVEVAFKDRDFVVTEKNNPRHLQLRTESEIWHKENMINLMVQRLPEKWRYVAWV